MDNMPSGANLDQRVVERNLRYNDYNGIAFTLAFNLFNPFLGIFALKLGAPDSYVALLSSLPALAGILALLPGARLIDRFAQKKAVTAWLIALNRAFYLAVALLPWIAPRHAAVGLVLLVGLMNIPGALAGVAWQSFIASIVPGHLRNPVFARRNLLMSAAGLIPLVAAGPLIDWLGSPLGYQVAFGLAFFIAAGEVAFFLRIQEPETPSGASSSLPGRRIMTPSALRLRLLGTWHRYPDYWRFTVAAFVFHIAWMMAWPLFTLYNVNVLGANNSWIAAISVVNTVAAVLTYRSWGRLADRIGTQPATALAALGLAGFPVFVALTKSLAVVTFLNIYVGVFGGAMGFLLLNSLLEVVPDQNRTGYIAVYNTLVNVAAATAPVAGVALLKVMPFENAFHLTGILRVLGALTFWLAFRWGQPLFARSPRASGNL